MRIPQAPKPFQELVKLIGNLGKISQAVQSADAENRYLHWDEIRFRTPPVGLSHEEWWLGIKLRRMGGFRRISLEDKNGNPFGFNIPDPVFEQLHQIDRQAGVLLQESTPITNPQTRDRYLMRSLVEEAITSSQLEGAATTREVAKKMLAECRAPKSTGEQMILNNFLTMQRIMEIKRERLTPDLVLDIHRRVSEHALDNPDASGRLRKADELVDVSNGITGDVYHVPPLANQLPVRLEAMCRFANGETPDYFIHPVVRAIILHFWLAYDHPFVDGNGRTARALFYWQMLHEGYWLFEFVSISHFLLKAPVQYGMAFLRTETDDNDLTYFLVHQTEVIRKALKELHDYIERKCRDIEACGLNVAGLESVNHRQQAILGHALRHPGFRYNIAGHRHRHAITYQTARTDLLELAKLNLLEQRKSGKAFVFVVPADLEKRLQNISVAG